MAKETGLRKDAAENRQKLIDAAREMMRERDGDVPLEAIAERAGISRGTVYRNFEDRLQLYGAVLAQDLERIDEDLKQSGRSADLMAVMGKLIEHMAINDCFRAALPDFADFREESCQQETIIGLLTPAMARAQADGSLRADATAAELLLACRMIASGWRLDLEPDRETALAKRTALILRGLAADSAHAVAENLTPKLLKRA